MAWPGLSISTLYSTLISTINTKFQEAAKLFNGVTITDPFVDQTRFNPTSKRMERYNGTAWVDLGLDAPTVGGSAASSFAASGHNHDAAYEGKNTNIQTHIAATAPHAGHALSGHLHDDRYYTETESNALYEAKNANIQTHIAAAAPHTGHALSGHLHDDRYYTETESDARFALAATMFLTRINRTSGGTAKYGQFNYFGDFYSSAAVLGTVYYYRDYMKFRSGSYGVSYVDAYDNYSDYANYVDVP